MKTSSSVRSSVVNLNDYRQIREISRGGFGVVYLVESKKDHRQYAAKVNIQGVISHSEPNKTIVRELNILIRVQAPTIIQFSGFSLKDFHEDNNITILMDYKQNGSLAGLIDKERQSLAPAEYDNTTKQIILCGIAHGMMILHSRRVIHRDLKPENVLLDENYYPCITDFGLSKFLDPDNSKSQSQGGCGTLAYIAPELHDSKHYGPKVDVYSFGILMYEVVTGERAFEKLMEKLPYHKFVTQVIDGKRPQFKAPIKPGLRQLIEQCWDKDPRKRPSFRSIFNKLSLSFEEDDEIVEDQLKDVIANSAQADEEEEEEQFDAFDYSRYCLDGVDYDRLLNYVDEITTPKTQNTEENLRQDELKRKLEEQAKRIDELEKQHQLEHDKMNNQYLGTIEELQKKIQQYEVEINSLKQQITDINNRPQDEHQTHSHLQQQESDKSKPFQKANQHEELTLKQIKEKVSRQRLTKITIPSSFKLIEDGAFKGCYSLIEIAIPSSVTTIGNEAFSDCTSLTQIIIPSSVTSIGNSAFSRCSSLTQITIPSSVSSIGNNTFYNCNSLTQITIPSSVTSIGNEAFSGCRSLKQITIPSSVTSIGDGAFSNCGKLDSTIKTQLGERFSRRIFDH